VQKELQYRRWMHYPPFTALANLVIQSDHLEQAAGWAATLGRFLEKMSLPKVRIIGPATAPLSRIKRIYRFHFVLKSESRAALSEALRAMLAHAAEQQIPRAALIADVDAVHLM